MALGTEVGLGPGHIVLDKDPAPTPTFWPMSILTERSPISATAELLLFIVLVWGLTEGPSIRYFHSSLADMAVQ